MLVLVLIVHVVIGTLGASPVEKRASGFAVVNTRSRVPMHLPSATGGKVFNKERALAERLRVRGKYVKKTYTKRGRGPVVKRSAAGEAEPFDVAKLRRRGTSNKETMTDEYDGIDEREEIRVMFRSRY